MAIHHPVVDGQRHVALRAYHQFLVVALLTGAALWAGFTATRILVHELFESRDLRIWVITAAYELVTILVMAAIIGLFGN